MLEKLLTGEVGLLYALLGEFLDHLCLGSDGGMVGAWHPEGVLAHHARTADEDILNGIVEHMAHMEHAGYVWRRNHDAVGFTLVGNGMEHFVALPVFIPFVFNLMRVVFCG